MNRVKVPAVALTAAAALLLAGAAPAAAHRDPRPAQPQTVAEGLAGPLSFDVAHGRLYVGEALGGALAKIKPGRAPVHLVGPGGPEVAAVSVHEGTVTFAQTMVENNQPTGAVLNRIDRRGKVRQVADLAAYERAHNPDADASYGLQGLNRRCTAKVGKKAPDFLPRGGVTESHPYGSVTTRGATYVADAGANAILRVDRRGRVSTTAVLPGTAVEVTKAIAKEAGLPRCAVGHDFVLEPVPTDVEVGRHGELYVTTLPGGPEDGSLGALGAVYRVDPRSGSVKLVIQGFLSATGLALAPDGTIYVAELFGNRVSAVDRHGKIRTVAELTQPAAVEWSRGRLYVSTDALGTDGTIVSLKVR